MCSTRRLASLLASSRVDHARTFPASPTIERLQLLMWTRVTPVMTGDGDGAAVSFCQTHCRTVSRPSVSPDESCVTDSTAAQFDQMLLGPNAGSESSSVWQLCDPGGSVRGWAHWWLASARETALLFDNK